jgi:mannose/cellobiose epimerase-like protein (N-acyl-D-glucosamine 2-epimerase family)
MHHGFPAPKKSNQIPLSCLLTGVFAGCTVLWSAAAFALDAAPPASPVGANSVVSPASPASPAQTALPSGPQWQQHLQQELLPFWSTPDALGTPQGNFPTFRCNDGLRFDASTHACPELVNPPAWIKADLTRDYVRMQARQTYAYGVGYHLTGDPKWLALARDGVQYLRTHALDKASGSAASYFENGKAGPDVLARTTQDLAYAEAGMAMYYYLTRDPAVLTDILRLKDHIFSNYFNADWGMLMWVKKIDGPGGKEEAARQELVAQLDQINAYMLLLTPILPAAEQTKWRQDLSKLAYIMIDKFYAPKERLMWGSLHNPADRVLGSRHTDFGHTIKAYWMIHQIGKLTGDKKLIDFAKKEAAYTLDKAFIPTTGSWGSRLKADGTLDQGKEWWIYAELDQMAATLALDEPSYASKYLIKTYGYWMNQMVDQKDHEIWPWVSPTGEHGDGPKIHPWKNGYHSMEHALVGYITSQALRGKQVALYFALNEIPPAAQLRPYLFGGVPVKQDEAVLPGFGDTVKLRVVFKLDMGTQAGK